MGRCDGSDVLLLQRELAILYKYPLDECTDLSLQRYPNDDWTLKLLVFVVWGLDTLHQGFILHSTYKYTRMLKF